jgi:retinol dehydrogenase 12
MYPSEMGALTSLYVGTTPELGRETSGGYFVPWARQGSPTKGTQDVNLAMKLWEFLDHDVERWGSGDETSERQA